MVEPRSQYESLFTFLAGVQLLVCKCWRILMTDIYSSPGGPAGRDSVLDPVFSLSSCGGEMSFGLLIKRLICYSWSNRTCYPKECSGESFTSRFWLLYCTFSKSSLSIIESICCLLSVYTHYVRHSIALPFVLYLFFLIGLGYCVMTCSQSSSFSIMELDIYKKVMLQSQKEIEATLKIPVSIIG